MPATQNQRRCDQVPHLPRETKVDVTKCHACHANSRGVTGDKTGPKGATPNEGGCHQGPRLPRRSGAAPRASRATKPGPRAPPSAMSEAPATQNDRGCEIVPRLPRETKVDVTKRHACHVKSRWMSPSATPATQKWCGATGVTRD